MTHSLINLDRVKEDSLFGDGVNFNSPTFDVFMSDLVSKAHQEKFKSNLLNEKKFTSESDLRNADSPVEIKTSSPLKKNTQQQAKQEAFRKQSVQNSTFDKGEVNEAKKQLNVTHSAHNSFEENNNNNTKLMLNSSGNSAESSPSSYGEEAPKPVFNTTYTSLNVNDDQFQAEVVQQNLNQHAMLNAKSEKKSDCKRRSAANTTIEIKKDNLNETFCLNNAKKDGTIDLGKSEKVVAAAAAPEIDANKESVSLKITLLPSSSTNSITSTTSTTSSQVSTQSNFRPSFIKSAIPRSAIPRKASASALPTMSGANNQATALPESKSYQNFKAASVLKTASVNTKVSGNGVASTTTSSLKENSSAGKANGGYRPSVQSSSEFKAPNHEIKR